MEEKREVLRARLMAQAEAVIDRMLADKRVSEEMTLSAIEAVTGGSSREFEQAALEALVGMQPQTVETCPVCGGSLLNKGKHRRQVVSLGGEVSLERTYYHCPNCRQGYFPPGSAIGVNG